MIWFTSDHHFGHARIIESCNRPFGSTEEMTEEMIQRWNACVKAQDTVYHLGDFALMRKEDIEGILARLNGSICLLKGNHDRAVTKCKLAWVKDYYELKVRDEDAPKGKQLIVLSHYAHKTWRNRHYGSWHLFGHSHGNLTPEPGSLDVGVDCWDYTPVSYDTIKLILGSNKI